mmetsp:Transcript_15294/g.35197  ORF Transcript_15294/g.35197 Transcript_15294/m.35197 type:complete len:275 (-) Transcript_15294:2064-2888(-)
MGDHGLHLGHRLRRRDELESAFRWESERRATLEVKVLLPPHPELALHTDDAVLRESRIHVGARLNRVLGHCKEGARRDGLLNRDDSWAQGLVLYSDHLSSNARLLCGLCDGDADDLSDVVDGLGGEALLVVHNGSDVVLARQVCGKEDRNHTLRGASALGVDRDEPRGRPPRAHETTVPRASGQLDVVHVSCFSRRVQCTRGVRQCGAHHELRRIDHALGFERLCVRLQPQCRRFSFRLLRLRDARCNLRCFRDRLILKPDRIVHERVALHAPR